MNTAWFASTAALPVRIVAGVTVVWLFAGLASLMLGRFSAALRHRLWSLTMLAALVTPIAVLLLPELRLGWIEPREDVAVHVARPLPVLTTENSGSPEPTVSPLPLGTRTPLSPSSLLPPSSNTTETSRPHSSNLPTPPSTSPNASIEVGTSSPVAGLGYLWLVVFLVPPLWQLIRIARSLAITRGLIRRAQPLADERAAKLLTLWCQRVGWRNEVRLLASAETNVPLCAGLWRPTVMLPVDWREWTDDGLSAALGHELAHAARRDVAWQLLARLACAIYWFHPLAYLATWRMRVERETACDDVVLAAGQPPAVYARVLLDLANRLSAERSLDLALPMAARTGLEQRVRAILAGGRARSPVGRASGLLLLAATCLAVLGVGSLSPLAPEIATAAVTAADEQPAVPKSNSDTVPTKATEVSEEEDKDTVEIQGDVVDESGKPAPDITVTLISNSQSRPTTRSGTDGKFSLRIRRSNYLYLVARSDDSRRQGFVRHAVDTKEIPQRERITLGKSREISVMVVDAEKRPVAEAMVAVTSGFGKATDMKSDKNGRAVLLVPAEMPLQYVYALKPDVGLDYFIYRGKDQPLSNPYQLAPDHAEPVTLTLAGVRMVRVRVLDDKKQPLAAVTVNPWYIGLPKKGGDFNTVWTTEITDQAGVAEFRTIPAGNTKTITFWPRKEKYFAAERTSFDPAGATSEVTSQLLPMVRVHGTVKFADGKPAGGAVVTINGDGLDIYNDNYHGEARCNAAGEFEKFVNSDEFYLFVASLERQISPAEMRVVRADKKTPSVELTLEPATRVFGTLYSPKDSKPLSGEYLVMSLLVDEYEYFKVPVDQRLPNKKGPSKPRITPRMSYETITDDKGRFEFFGGRGQYNIMGTNLREKSPKFKLDREKEHELRLGACRVMFIRPDDSLRLG